MIMFSTNIILFIFTLAPLKSKIIIEQKNLFYILLTAILARYVIAIINSAENITPGSQYDAVTFFQNASKSTNVLTFNFDNGAVFYESILGLLFFFTGPSRFLGSQLSILAFSLAALYFVKIFHAVHFIRLKSFPFILFTSLPSSIFFTSTTLRESFQLLCTVLFIYFCLLLIKQKKPVFITWAKLVASSFFLTMFHHALFSFVAGVFVSLLFFARSFVFKFSLSILILISIIFGFSTLNLIFHGGIIASINEFQSAFLRPEYLVQGRTTYKQYIPFETTLDAILLIPKSVFYYITMPLPELVRHPIDLYAFFEVLLRLFFLFFIFVNWRWTLNSSEKKFLFVTYFLMLTLWAVGTVNYGTGLRHHILDMWFLYILAFPIKKSAISSS